MINFQPNFSHIYVERDAFGFELTDLALSKFPRATVIKIGHYKDVFNRPGKERALFFWLISVSWKIFESENSDPDD